MPIDLSTLNIIFGIFVFLFGISIGSFLNVVAYRIPLNISIVRPRSFCPNCKKTVPNYALIPVIGYILTHAKCNKCNYKIPITYPIVELLTGILTLFIFFRFLTPINVLEAFPAFLTVETFQYGKFHFNNFVPFFVSLWILYTGIPLSIIDLKYRILPNKIIYPGIIIGFLISCFNHNLGWSGSLIGIITGSGGLFFIAKIYELLRGKQGIGMGDVKYLGFIGAVLGWKGVVFTLFYASIIGAIIGILWGIISKKGLATAIPFGPFLASAALAISTYGDEILAFIFKN
ncbi:prepilin peptidase [Pigmentibacter ruber]|uniref:prepilin peptidase n=1 Tax=Pigmentibacter ruber TaxID=2683196 RepID=UPI00131DC89B|nr:A24 family peptidase [Pigmentibacter ruber]